MRDARDPVPARSRTRTWPGVLAAFVLLLALPAGADAATLPVTNTNDSGPGSLRAAIMRANQLSGPDRIAIEATGTIPLVFALPTLTTEMVIDGPGPRNLSLESAGPPGNLNPALKVSGDVDVTVAGVSINDTEVAIENLGGDLVFRHSTLNNNRYGIMTRAGKLRVDGGSSLGGAVQAINSSRTDTRVHRSTLHDTSVAILSGEGRLHVTQSALIGNGTGVFVTYGGALVDSSTLNGNSVGAVNYEGGGLGVSRSTLSGNSIAISSSEFANSTHLLSTIVANSTGGPNCIGTMISEGFNLADDGTCNLSGQGDKPNTEPLLRPLASNGGPTKTHALRPTSPAVDAGLAGSATTDQRGLPRIVNYPGVPKAVGGDNSDIGAFELQSP